MKGPVSPQFIARGLNSRWRNNSEEMRAVTRTMNHRCEWKRGKREITPRLMIILGVVGHRIGYQRKTTTVAREMKTTTDGQFVNIPATVMLHLVVGHHKKMYLIWCSRITASPTTGSFISPRSNWPTCSSSTCLKSAIFWDSQRDSSFKRLCKHVWTNQSKRPILICRRNC